MGKYSTSPLKGPEKNASYVTSQITLMEKKETNTRGAPGTQGRGGGGMGFPIGFSDITNVIYRKKRGPTTPSPQ